MMKQSQKLGGWGPRGLWGVVYSEDGKKTGSRKKGPDCCKRKKNNN
jgi:hypothetical protein